MFPEYEYKREYRKMVTGDFLVFYKMDEVKKQVNIYRILHGKRSVFTILKELGDSHVSCPDKRNTSPQLDAVIKILAPLDIIFT